MQLNYLWKRVDPGNKCELQTISDTLALILYFIMGFIPLLHKSAALFCIENMTIP